MPRPKLDDPRSKRLVVRCTPLEETRVKAAAAAAGLSQTDYLRSRVLDVRPQAGLLEPTTVVPRAEPRKLTKPGRWYCPEPGCLENGESKEERCQKHGTLMLSRG